MSGPGPAARRRTGRGIAITAPGPPPAGSAARLRGKGEERARKESGPSTMLSGAQGKPCLLEENGVSPPANPPQVRWG